MAINYLNSIDLNKNELLQGVIENQPNDASAGSSPVTGQIYYNTTDYELRQYNGTAWVSVGDITSLTPGTNISIDNPASSSPTINLIDNPTLAGNLTISKTTPKLIITDTVASDLILEISQQGSTTSFTSRGGTSSTGQFNFRITNGSTTTNALFINQQARATFAGDVVVTDELTVSGTGQSSVAGQLTIPQVPSADTDAASKHYVDQAVTGALSYQGAYNAATNTPDLDSSPSSDIKTGWTYTVTVEGLFFTEQVRVGDVLIAEIDSPTALADWTTVQNNIDLADLTTVGIGNVNQGGGINVSYSNGTATVSGEDSSATNKGIVIVSAGTGISVGYSSGTATITNTDTNSGNTATGTITAGNLTGTVTHAFGINTIVQTIDSSGNTVYCDISRTATTSVATIATAEATDITILVQKIG